MPCAGLPDEHLPALVRASRTAAPPLHPACRDAKLSVLAWDAATAELAPSSLHYFQGDASLKAGRATFACPPLAATGAAARRWAACCDAWGCCKAGTGTCWDRRGSPVATPSLRTCLSPRADPLGRCGAVLFFRHQLAVLPAVESDLLALGLTADGQEEALLGLLGVDGAPTPGGPSAGAAQGGTAGAAAGGAAAAGPAAAAAAAVGNSYVDNLGKAGIKEVRPAVPAVPAGCQRWRGKGGRAHTCCAGPRSALLVVPPSADLHACALTHAPLFVQPLPPVQTTPPHHRSGTPCSCTATTSRCWRCCTRGTPPGPAT